MAQKQPAQNHEPAPAAEPAPRPDMGPAPSAEHSSLAGKVVSADMVQEHQAFHSQVAQHVADTAAAIHGDHPSPHSDEPQRLAAEYHETWHDSPTAPGRTVVETDSHPYPFEPTLPQGTHHDETLHRPAGHMLHLAPPAQTGGVTRVLTPHMALASPAPTPRPDDTDLTGWADFDAEHQIGDTGNREVHMAPDHEAPERLGETEERQAPVRLEQEHGEYSVGELVDYLPDINEPGQLDRLEEAENSRSGGPRPRAVAAIRERRAELAAS